MKKSLVSLFPVIFAVLSLAVPAFAQSAPQAGHRPSIVINDVEVAIGMDKSLALSRLRARNDAKPFSSQPGGAPSGGDDAFCVLPRSGGAWLDCDMVIFQNDKLVGIVHGLGNADGDHAAGILSKFYAMISDAERSQYHVSVVDQGEFERDRWRHRTISFFLGPKQLDLEILEPIGGGEGRTSSVSLSEAIYDYPHGYSTIRR